jgi:hypothetical protein
MEFEEQANLIIGMLSRYNVQHIGIDGTGIGEAVYQLVKKHFPAAVCYQFSPASKRMLVLKMQQLFAAAAGNMTGESLISLARSTLFARLSPPAALSLTTLTAHAASVMAISHGRRCLPPLTSRWDRKAAAV